MIRKLRPRKLTVLAAALFVIGGSLSLAFYVIGVPPNGIAPDGHDPAAVLATGSTTALTTQELVQLFESVAAFHTDIPTHADGNPGIPANACLACHSNITDLETIVRKMPNLADGSITSTEDINHHKTHATKSQLNFGEACTFCHREFDTELTTESVTIASYVDKTICAGCHSRFSPRGLMDVSYYEENGCPGCHDPGDVDAWVVLHAVDQGPFNPPGVYGPYLNIDKIDPSERGCLICHGENKLKMPEDIQDLFWQARE